jgi:hypothetical protein
MPEELAKVTRKMSRGPEVIETLKKFAGVAKGSGIFSRWLGRQRDFLPRAGPK